MIQSEDFFTAVICMLKHSYQRDHSGRAISLIPGLIFKLPEYLILPFVKQPAPLTSSVPQQTFVFSLFPVWFGLKEGICVVYNLLAAGCFFHPP